MGTYIQHRHDVFLELTIWKSHFPKHLLTCNSMAKSLNIVGGIVQWMGKLNILCISTVMGICLGDLTIRCFLAS